MGRIRCVLRFEWGAGRTSVGISRLLSNGAWKYAVGKVQNRHSRTSDPWRDHHYCRQHDLILRSFLMTLVEGPGLILSRPCYPTLPRDSLRIVDPRPNPFPRTKVSSQAAAILMLACAGKQLGLTYSTSNQSFQSGEVNASCGSPYWSLSLTGLTGSVIALTCVPNIFQTKIRSHNENRLPHQTRRLPNLRR